MMDLFFPLLTILFIYLKLAGSVTWSWLWVLSPLWLGIPLWILFVVVIVSMFAYITKDW